MKECFLAGHGAGAGGEPNTMIGDIAITPALALARAQADGLERLDAQMLMLLALGQSPHDRAWLLAHDTDPLPPDVASRFDALVARRADGEPLAYLTGSREFHGLTLQVDRRVLDPRSDTETLVDWALDVLQQTQCAKVVDLGTGSGAIALAIQKERPDLQVHAVDVSTAALQVARANGQALGLPVHWHQGHWLDGLELRAFHLIVSNPPYIAQGDHHLAALRHEPISALVSGDDGLDDIRTIVAQAPAHLAPGGWLLMEHGFDQAEPVRDLLAQHGFVDVQSRRVHIRKLSLPSISDFITEFLKAFCDSFFIG